jgi:hypothetical protein
VTRERANKIYNKKYYQKTLGLSSDLPMALTTFCCSVDPTCAEIYVNTYSSALHLLGEYS